MALDPQVTELIGALTDSARSGLALAAGLEKLDARHESTEEEVKRLRIAIEDLVTQLKIQNGLEEKTDQIRRDALTTAGKFADRVWTGLTGRAAMAFYVLVLYTVLSIFGMDERARGLLRTLVPAFPVPPEVPVAPVAAPPIQPIQPTPAPAQNQPAHEEPAP